MLSKVIVDGSVVYVPFCVVAICVPGEVEVMFAVIVVLLVMSVPDCVCIVTGKQIGRAHV